MGRRPRWAPGVLGNFCSHGIWLGVYFGCFTVGDLLDFCSDFNWSADSVQSAGDKLDYGSAQLT